YNQYLFFFNTPTTSECYTLSLHDALPICKTMENLRKRQRVSIVQPITDPKKYKKLTSDPSFKSRKIFSENLVVIHRRKTEVNLNRPTYIGMCVLDLSKLCMYQFYYDTFKA